jgi:hypothetical protein
VAKRRTIPNRRSLPGANPPNCADPADPRSDIVNAVEAMDCRPPSAAQLTGSRMIDFLETIG